MHFFKRFCFICHANFLRAHTHTHTRQFCISMAFFGSLESFRLIKLIDILSVTRVPIFISHKILQLTIRCYSIYYRHYQLPMHGCAIIGGMDIALNAIITPNQPMLYALNRNHFIFDGNGRANGKITIYSLRSTKIRIADERTNKLDKECSNVPPFFWLKHILSNVSRSA